VRKWQRSGLVAGPIALAALAASAALSSGDRNFVQAATSGGLAEVATAQLVQQRSASPQVRKFADRMIADHTQANSELQQIVEQQDITLSTQPIGKDAAAEAKLRSLNGAAFDRAYLQAAVSDHQQAIALFSREASSGQDPALKAFAQQKLPMLQQHLQLAQSLNSSNR
jgi:putative membrane protein